MASSGQQVTLRHVALPSTVRRLKLELSDADRSVYASLDLRLAQHPSETDAYLVTRVLAYALSHEEGIAFSHGLGNADEPAVWVKSADGRTLHWIEVGTPSAERLHRASKAAHRVSVFTQHPVALLQREAARLPIHRVEHIQIFAPEPALIGALTGCLSRNMAWELVRNDGQLYVTADGTLHEGGLHQHTLLAS
ncbi:MAG: hypothetical protein RL385_2013 [Pseudomonadota bacterium]|jgi:uncharacterized protein YaeQ